MPIVNANKTLTDELEIGRKLTVVVSYGGSAALRMYQAGQDLGAIQLSSGSSNTFGPFTSAINYAVDCFSGSADVNESQPSDDAVVLGGGPEASVGGGLLPEYIGPVGVRSAYPDTFSTGTITKYIKGIAIEKIVSDTNVIAPVFAAVCGLGTDENSMLTGTFTGRMFVTYKGESAWVSFNGTPGGTGIGQMGDVLYPDTNAALPFTVKAGDSVAITYDLAFFPDGNNRYPYYQDGYNLGFTGVGELCITSATPMAPIELGVTPTTTGGGTVQTAFSYRPFFVLGKTSEHTVFITGDSINRGPVTFNRNVYQNRTGVTGVLPALLAKAGIGFINASFSGDNYLNASQAGKYTKRGSLAAWATTWLPMLGTNDLGNASTLSVSQFRDYMNGVKTQLAGWANKIIVPATIMARAANSPLTTAANLITYATAQVAQANNASRVAICEAIRKGDILGETYLEVAAYMETVPNSGLQPTPGYGRTLTDISTTNGSNVIGSVSAKFNESITGQRVLLVGYGAAGADTSAFLVYNSATQANVVSQTGAAVNAGASLTNVTGYVGITDWTDDALHVSPRGRDEVATRMIAAGEHLKIARKV